MTCSDNSSFACPASSCPDLYFSAGSDRATFKGKYANSGYLSQNLTGGALFGAFCLKSEPKRFGSMALFLNKNPSKTISRQTAMEFPIRLLTSDNISWKLVINSRRYAYDPALNILRRYLLVITRWYSHLYAQWPCFRNLIRRYWTHYILSLIHI